MWLEVKVADDDKEHAIMQRSRRYWPTLLKPANAERLPTAYSHSISAGDNGQALPTTRVPFGQLASESRGMG